MVYLRIRRHDQSIVLFTSIVLDSPFLRRHVCDQGKSKLHIVDDARRVL